MTRLKVVIGVLAAILVFVVGSGDVARADPDTVTAGYDLLETAGETYIDFSVAPVPAGFFGPGSDPFEGQVALQGNPFGSFGGFSGLTPTDTIVRRLQDAAAFPATIDIEIVRLELVSIAPLTVTYNGGEDPENWDLAVQVTEGDTEQTTGSMIIRHPPGDGGTFDITDLPVRPLLTFTPVGGGGSQTLRFPSDTTYIHFEVYDEVWCHTANPLAVPPGQIVIQKGGLTTNFFPGIDCGPPRTKGTVVLDASDGVARHTVRSAERAAPVGGIAELPDASDSPASNYIALSALAAGVLVVVTAGAWYARRRWLS